MDATRRPRSRRAAFFVLLATAAALVTALAGTGTASAVPGSWNFRQIDVPTAQLPGHNGSGVVVAVVDTWIDASQPDFAGRVRPGADCASGTCRRGPVAPDACYHGTHVAGIVASTHYGVAPAATILPIRVLTGHRAGHCSGTQRSVGAAIRWATAHGADVINLSIGTAIPNLSASSDVAAAVHAAARAGIVVVFVAGNAGQPLADNYGGDALIVAATGPDATIASYSQRGHGVTLAAPGGDAGSARCSPATCVVSTFPHGRYAALEGTSMAAPHVAGLAALLIGQNPHRSREKTVRLIERTARPLAGAGDGLIDAGAALRAGKPVRPKTSPTAATQHGAGSGHVTDAASGAPPRPAASTTSAQSGRAPARSPMTVVSGADPGDLGRAATRPSDSAAAQAASATDPPRVPVYVAAGLIVLVALGLIGATRPRKE